ncbi:MAG: hypothetical protein L0Y66_18450 [Myxococcaceae bacterium]|nr:hypothetical protein [Myxococcaceae bacterium]MCI0668853.1 hypothetical protein [Myxococcaceae bacterium]
MSAFECFVSDNDAANNWTAGSFVELEAKELPGTTQFAIPMIGSLNLATSGASTEMQTVSASFVSDAAIRNGTYSYNLRVVLSGTNATGEVRFYGCRITYTLASVAP